MKKITLLTIGLALTLTSLSQNLPEYAPGQLIVRVKGNLYQKCKTATYSAYNEINLNEGFTAEAGSNFTAEIVQCPLDCKYPPVYINTMSILSEYYNYDEVNNMIIDTLINSEITISPNPFTDFIEIKNDIIKIDKIEIINMQSKVVYEKNNIGNSIYLGFLENGIYLLKIYTSDNIYVKKIIKQ